MATKPAHHRDSGFQNNYADLQSRGLAAFARWRFEAWRAGLPAAPSAPTPAIVPDLGFIQSNARAGVRMKRLVVTVIAAGAALTSLSAAAQFQKPEDAIKYRQSVMTVMANHLGRVGAMCQPC